MKENNKKYSFVISLYEYGATIPSLWDSVKKFTGNHPEHVAEGNAMEFISNDGGETYNNCHFVSTSNWSSFLIFNLPNLSGSGQTLRLVAWSGCDPMHTLIISRLWTRMAASSMSDGVTHRFTLLPLH
jgi:hypothetical protein